MIEIGDTEATYEVTTIVQVGRNLALGEDKWHETELARICIKPGISIIGKVMVSKES